MTDLPEMTPSVEERLVRAHSRAGGYSEAIATAFRDGALAERERIVAMLCDCPEPIINNCLEERVRHRGEHMADQFRAVLRAIADRIAAEGKDDNG